MIKSDKIFSVQNYLETITGNYYDVGGDDDVAFIENIIDRYTAYSLWNYPLTEIGHIYENDIDVVLVDCLVFDENEHEFKHEYRWFEIPKEMEI